MLKRKRQKPRSPSPNENRMHQVTDTIDKEGNYLTHDGNVSDKDKLIVLMMMVEIASIAPWISSRTISVIIITWIFIFMVTRSIATPASWRRVTLFLSIIIIFRLGIWEWVVNLGFMAIRILCLMRLICKWNLCRFYHNDNPLLKKHTENSSCLEIISLFFYLLSEKTYLKSFMCNRCLDWILEIDKT